MDCRILDKEEEESTYCCEDVLNLEEQISKIIGRPYFIAMSYICPTEIGHVHIVVKPQVGTHAGA